MAVTLTIAALSGALRLSDDAAEQAEAMRLLAYATEAVEQHAPDAPEATQNEAVIRLAAYLYDQPNAGRGLVLCQRFEELRGGNDLVALPGSPGGIHGRSGSGGAGGYGFGRKPRHGLDRCGRRVDRLLC